MLSRSMRNFASAILDLFDSGMCAPRARALGGNDAP
jgi:hypothetical protein